MSQIAKYVLSAAAALVLTVWQAAALGSSLEGDVHSQSIAVRYADLDLSRPADVRVLYQRIHRAADQACGIGQLTGSHLPLPSWQSCVAQTVDQTVTRLDRPALSAYHREHTSEAARKG